MYEKLVDHYLKHDDSKVLDILPVIDSKDPAYWEWLWNHIDFGKISSSRHDAKKIVARKIVQNPHAPVAFLENIFRFTNLDDIAQRKDINEFPQEIIEKIFKKGGEALHYLKVNPNISDNLFFPIIERHKKNGVVPEIILLHLAEGTISKPHLNEKDYRRLEKIAEETQEHFDATISKLIAFGNKNVLNILIDKKLSPDKIQSLLKSPHIDKELFEEIIEQFIETYGNLIHSKKDPALIDTCHCFMKHPLFNQKWFDMICPDEDKLLFQFYFNYETLSNFSFEDEKLNKHESLIEQKTLKKIMIKKNIVPHELFVEMLKNKDSILANNPRLFYDFIPKTQEETQSFLDYLNDFDVFYDIHTSKINQWKNEHASMFLNGLLAHIIESHNMTQENRIERYKSILYAIVHHNLIIDDNVLQKISHFFEMLNDQEKMKFLKEEKELWEKTNSQEIQRHPINKFFTETIFDYLSSLNQKNANLRHGETESLFSFLEFLIKNPSIQEKILIESFDIASNLLKNNISISSQKYIQLRHEMLTHPLLDKMSSFLKMYVTYKEDEEFRMIMENHPNSPLFIKYQKEEIPQNNKNLAP